MMTKLNLPQLVQELSDIKNPNWLYKREPAHYTEFYALYCKIGYLPKEQAASLFEQVKATWQQQDNLIPGSCTGGWYKGELVSSLGTLPISAQVAYGHSFCMDKSLSGILTMLPQMVRSATLATQMPGIKYYAGSYKNSSRFTSKFYTIPSENNQPTGQLFIQSLDLTPAKALSEAKPYPYQLEAIKLDTIQLPVATSTLIKLLGEAHPTLEKVHQIKLYAIKSTQDGKTQAIVIYQDSPTHFTAIDIFKRSWVILNDANQAGTDICAFLRSQHQFKSQTLELLTADAKETPIYTGPDHAVPRCWVFSPVELIPQLKKYLFTTISRLLSKYPAAQLEKVYQELMTTAEAAKQANFENTNYVPIGKNAATLFNSSKQLVAEKRTEASIDVQPTVRLTAKL